MKRLAFILSMVLFFIFSIGVSAETVKSFIDQKTIDAVKETLVKQYGEPNRSRIEKGVRQVAMLWTESDGTPGYFGEFCKNSFILSPEELDANFKRLEMYFEIIGGYFTEMKLDLNQPLDLDWGEIKPIDMAIGEYSPSAHVTDDLFANKIVFAILLNYPHYSLSEKIRFGETWNRKEWAYARMGDQFTSRIPAPVSQEISSNLTQAGAYISDYNIYVGQLIDQNNKTYFPPNMKLLSHWNLRDELKARYNDSNGLYKQQMIYKVMEHIIDQDIPQVVINNRDVQWNPYSNTVYDKGVNIPAKAEPDTRYLRFLNVFKAMKKADPYTPYLPTYINRIFEDNRELPEAEVEALFKELLSSKEVTKVASIIQKRLKRKLYPFDIWYNGFKPNRSVSEEELDKITAAKYPNALAFEAGIPDILLKMGFSDNDAKFIASKIRVDPARGSGHCASTDMKSGKVRLRTRVPSSGMNYKGFNIAVHELGHAVESVLTLQKMDYYLLRSVPNIAFTEAFAFLFQDRDLDILGVKQDNPQSNYFKSLDIFWSAYECMGVGLLDMKSWNWLYNNPNATPAELKKAVITFAKEIWNQYYAPIFKIKDQTILAIYSHMIDSALYLPDYPIGYLIQFQIEKYMEGKNIGKEMERMCASGKIIPQLWMKNAVGAKISVKPLIDAVNESLKYIK